MPGLYAAGNCSDGAYICLGQTLYIAGLTGWWAGEHATPYARQVEHGEVSSEQVESCQKQYLQPLEVGEGLTFEDVRDQVQELLLSLFPVINDIKLQRCVDELGRLEREEMPRLRAREPRELAKVCGMNGSVRVLGLVLQVMLHRKESRGNIFREDYPYSDNDHWLCHTVLQKQANGKIKLWDIPVPERWWLIHPKRTKSLHPFFAEEEDGR